MMQDFLDVAGARRNPVLGRCGARVQGLRKTLRPGGVGAPPGGTMAPCQELADGRGAGRKPPLRQKARPGAETRTPRWRAGVAPARVPATGA